MKTQIVTIIGLCSAMLAIPADAASPYYNSSSQVCPSGTSPGRCLDNAIAAIDDLERRVAILEGRGGAASQGTGYNGQQMQGSFESGQQPPAQNSHGCKKGWEWEPDLLPPRCVYVGN